MSDITIMRHYNKNVIPITESNHHFDQAAIDQIDKLFDLLVESAGDAIKKRFERDPDEFDGKVLAILNSGSRSSMSIAAANRFLNDLH